jgi:hypothetical protein
LDFHSTYHDVFYTQADDQRTFPVGFTRVWLTRIQQRFPDYRLRREAKHGASTTSKAWVHRVLGAPAITYEFGDKTDQQQIRRLARGAADEMMQSLHRTLHDSTAVSLQHSR